jgi:flavin reductase (DIM6/NTAB) family NADH-FMN oxidoreductase RutF
MSRAGQVNLAPYSFFNGVLSRPRIVGFCSETEKDAAAFAIESGEFSWSMATWALRDKMNATSAGLPRGQSEFEFAGLATAPCRMIRAPRVADSPAAMECKVTQVVRVLDMDGRETGGVVVYGQVIGMHIDGVFAEYMAAPQDICVKLPENASLEVGSLLEAAGVAVHAIQRAGSAVAGRAVLVSGGGPVGRVVDESVHADEIVDRRPGGIGIRVGRVGLRLFLRVLGRAVAPDVGVRRGAPEEREQQRHGYFFFSSTELINHSTQACSTKS